MMTFPKILNTILILVAVFMGIKQGWAMISGKPAMLEMFGKFDVGKTGTLILGLFTVLGAVLMLFPKTFLYGNYIMAAGILFIMALELNKQDLKSAMIELPFLVLSLVIIYLKHPLATAE